MAYRFDKPVIALALTPEEANVLDNLLNMVLPDRRWDFLGNMDALVQVKVKLRAEATGMNSSRKRIARSARALLNPEQKP